MCSCAGSLAGETTCPTKPGVRTGQLERGISALENGDCFLACLAGFIAGLDEGSTA
jgi:hypothetical protein